MRDLGTYLDFTFAGFNALASWCLAFCLFIKIGSTAVGLWQRRGDRSRAGSAASIWWSSKVSALGLGATAAWLCHLADDRVGFLFFCVLETVACLVVLTLAARRIKGQRADFASE